MRRFFWLAAVAISTMPAAAAPSCDNWNSKEFFSQATSQDVERCLQTGADPVAKDEDGWTPLHWAAGFSDNPEVITELAEAGADLEARDDREGWTPLHQAAATVTNPDVITMLLDAGADGSARTNYGKSA